MTLVSKESRSAKVVDRAILACFFLIVALVLVLLNAPDVPRMEAPLTVGSLAAVPPEVDLGQVEQGVAVPFSFALVNNDRDPVEICEFTRPCSCTQLNLRVGTVIGPRSELRVDGKVDTTGKRNAFIGSFPITYKQNNSKTKTTCVATLKMAVRPAIIASAEKVVLSGDDWSTVKLACADGRSFRVKSVELSSREIRWEPVDCSIDQETDLFKLRLRWNNPGGVPRATTAWLKFETTVRTEPELQLPVSFAAAAGR